MSMLVDAETAHRLRDWLAARLSEQTGGRCRDLELISAERISKGQSSHMLQLACRWRQGAGEYAAEYIVRCEPRAHRLFLDPDVTREAEVLRGLERSGTVPVPHVWWIEKDDTLLGAPFFVMSRVDGTVPLGRPSMHVSGLLTALEPGQRARLWTSAMETLVAIHAIDWRSTHGFLVPQERRGGHLGAYLERCAKWYRWACAGRTFPITDAALDYLRRRSASVDPEEAVLVWNDARVGNMMFGAEQRVVAVLDWEGALIGPPGIDVGYWLMMDELHADAIGIERLPGWPSAEEAIRKYEDLSGRRIRDVEYFIVFAAFFIATTLIRQADLAVAQGRLPADTTMATANTATQIIARRIGLPVPGLSPDFARHRGLSLPTTG